MKSIVVKSKLLFLTMGLALMVVPVLITACSKETEEKTTGEVVRPVKLMTIGSGEEPFLIPVSAFTPYEVGKKYVWVVDQETMRVQRREVKVGEVGDIKGGCIPVINGLASGDKIITAGDDYLHPGMKVREIEGKVGD